MKIDVNLVEDFRGIVLGLAGVKPTIYYSQHDNSEFYSIESLDGLEFTKTESQLVIHDLQNQVVDLNKVLETRVSPLFKDFILFYEIEDVTHTALSQDKLTWKEVGKLPVGVKPGLNVENYVYKNQHVFYYGGKKIKIGLTDDGTNWRFFDTNLDGEEDCEVDYAVKTTQGLFVLHHYYSIINSKKHLQVKAACFDKNDPTKVLWNTKSSLWHTPEVWQDKEVNCIGCINFNGTLLSYWNVKGVGLFLVTYPVIDETPAHEHNHFKLDKHPANPILSPKSENDWENEATFNPAAFYDNDKVYLIYRAVGHDYISVLGYAESTDGINFERKFNSPIFTGSAYFDTRSPRSTHHSVKKYKSGPGYGGCEDPRITRVGNKLYMIYVAFNGYSEPRLAFTSILYENFINHRFLWEKPVLISPPGIIDKSGCVLPEKINGKYVIFHRIYPNILIDFVDNLNFDGKTYLSGQFKIEPRPTMWDSRKIGVGAPPIKTKDGWLLIYQAVTDNDDSKYKIGAMLLDLNNPANVLYRSNHPIIEPTEHYENNLAKFGVVYPCGAVIVNSTLMVYYGGSDSVTCVATANLDEFLNELKSGNGAHLSPVKIHD